MRIKKINLIVTGPDNDDNSREISVLGKGLDYGISEFDLVSVFKLKSVAIAKTNDGMSQQVKVYIVNNWKRSFNKILMIGVIWSLTTRHAFGSALCMLSHCFKQC